MNERQDDWQRATDRQLDDLELRYDAIDRVLRGNHEDKEDGLIAEVHAIDIKVNDIRAELFRIKQFFSDEKHERREDRRLNWGNITKIIIAIITSGTVGIFWRDIRSYIEKHEKTDFFEMTKSPKHPKPRHRRNVVRTLPIPPPLPPKDPDNPPPVTP